MLGVSFQEYAIYWIGMALITMGAVGAGIWQMIKHRQDD
jgi:cytochrome oxidase assembly protein ShyY1